MPGDMFGLPDNADHQQTFNYSAGAAGAPANGQCWLKPRGITMVHMFLVASGGGGGGGLSGATSTTRGGGGGGGGGNVASLLIPAIFLPSMLYVFVAAGGAGGAASTTGGSGAATTVGYLPALTQVQSLITTGGTPVGGTAGNTTGNAAGGTGASAAAISTYLLAGAAFGIYSFGPAGNNGDTGIGGSAYTANLFQPCSGGAGGGTASASNLDTTGDTIRVQYLANGGNSYYINSNGAAAGTNGANGMALNPGGGQPGPILWTGGNGGGSLAAGTGGAGGNGAIGCGGGGGGGGITGGAGGAGGPGLVVISAF
jgi:hypothetical protein